MYGKSEDRAEKILRLPQDETPQTFTGWLSEAQRLPLGTSRPAPRGK
jgi:hypothetical protein